MQTMVAVGADRLWAEDSQGPGPALVLLPAGLSDARLWDPAWPELTAAFRVIRYESRGSGRSPAASEPFTELGDLRAVLDHFAIPAAHLAGCSRGGGTAAELALTRPDRVRSLVLLGPAFPDPVFGRLAELRAPTVIMVGDRDASALIASNVRAARRIPRCTLIRLPGVDHYPPVRDPAAVIRAIMIHCLPPEPWQIRPAGPQDAGFLADMLVEAVNWSPRWNQSRDSIFATPQIAHYVSGWPRDGDLGVLAQAGGQPVGAAWLRFLPPDDPGYGFVAADVPELTIGVDPLWRGRGVGRALLAALAGRARAAGIARISLSVERENYARRLYQAAGYRVVGASDRHSDTMITSLCDTDAMPDTDNMPGPERSPDPLHELEQVLISRRELRPEGSYSAQLFADQERLMRKVMEEAFEVCLELGRAPVNADAVAAEAADLVYHLMAGLVSVDVDLDRVLAVLAARRR
jgi:phosphoribosyl-ATP pyrophosphohydrolase